jgi:hypothetical protein
MRRLGRWAFNLLAAFSLLLLAISGMCWARSYFYESSVSVPIAGSRSLELIAYRGGMYVAVFVVWHGAPHFDMHDEHISDLQSANIPWLFPDLPATRGYGFMFGSATGLTFARIPFWFITIVLLLPVVIAIRWHVTRRRNRVGLRCPRCGYDLRATPARCPECGNIPATSSQSPTDSTRSAIR